MAVCRRCGIQTDDPKGLRHVPDERQVLGANKWLDGQLRMSTIERARTVRMGGRV
jgi:hypothetical protein